jgi:hypothetical protein
MISAMRSGALSAYGGSRGTKIETGSPKDLDRSEGIASDFLQNLEKRETMTKSE